MSNDARRGKRLFAGFIAGAMALSVAPVLGFTGVAGADAHLEAADPIGAGNFCEAVPDDNPFTDVTAADPSFDEILCLVATEVTTGVTATTYEPNSFVTRRQMALFLTRVAEEANRLEIGDNIEELPAPAANEFADVEDEEQFIQDAISQISQAEIAQGFADGTYGPAEPVTRRQMAAFIDRLYTYLTGEELPRATEDNFSDDDEDSAEAQESTNAVAEAGIFIGNEDGTFNPAQEITRRQMANVLTRTFEVLFENGEIEQWSAEEAPPESNQSFTVTPDTFERLTFTSNPDTDTSDDRQYSVTELDDGTNYRIQLFPAQNVTVDENGVVTFAEAGSTNSADEGAVEADITVVNGSAVVTPGDAAEAQPVNGTITFTVDGDAAESVVPVVYVDADGGDDLDLNADDEPTEDFGIGGETEWVPAEAAQGAAIAVPASVDSVNKTEDYFTASGQLFEYDANDAYTVDGNQATFEQFEAALSSTDTIAVADYQPDEALQSGFDLTDSNPAAPTGVTATQDGTAVEVAWMAPGGDVDSYNIYRALSANDTDCTTTAATSYSLVGTDTATPFTDETISVGEEYCYTVAAVNDGDQGDLGGPAFVGTQAVDTVAPTSEDARVTTNILTGDEVETGDEWEIVFSEVMAAPTATSTIRVQDADGTVADVVCDGASATCALNAGTVTAANGTEYEAGRVLTVTIGAAGPTVVTAGTNPGVQYPASVLDSADITDLQGNTWDEAASPDQVIDEEA